MVDAKDGGAFFALAAHSHRVAVDLFDVGLVEDVHAVHAQPLDFVEPALVCKELLGGLIRFIDEVDLARSGVEMGDDAERAADVFGGVADAPGAAPFIVRLQVVGAEMARDVHGDVSAADDGDTVADGHAPLQQVLKRKDVGRVDAGNVGHAGFLARGEQDPASAVVVLNPLRGGASVADDFDAELDELALLHLEKLRD